MRNAKYRYSPVGYICPGVELLGHRKGFILASPTLSHTTKSHYFLHLHKLPTTPQISRHTHLWSDLPHGTDPRVRLGLCGQVSGVLASGVQSRRQGGFRLQSGWVLKAHRIPYSFLSTHHGVVQGFESQSMGWGGGLSYTSSCTSVSSSFFWLCAILFIYFFLVYYQSSLLKLMLQKGKDLISLIHYYIPWV